MESLVAGSLSGLLCAQPKSFLGDPDSLTVLVSVLATASHQLGQHRVVFVKLKVALVLRNLG